MTYDWKHAFTHDHEYVSERYEPERKFKFTVTHDNDFFGSTQRATIVVYREGVQVFCKVKERDDFFAWQKGLTIPGKFSHDGGPDEEIAVTDKQFMRGYATQFY